MKVVGKEKKHTNQLHNSRMSNTKGFLSWEKSEALSILLVRHNQEPLALEVQRVQSATWSSAVQTAQTRWWPGTL